MYVHSYAHMCVHAYVYICTLYMYVAMLHMARCMEDFCGHNNVAMHVTLVCMRQFFNIILSFV